ncbi:MAG: Hsp33 family molecular chaperone HslO [Lachnospiraceae bacterium]|nr:Hsp33 family molecular chaperone HslO [Lachnospiraceae bacterium]
MGDYIIRGMAMNNEVRFFAATTKDLVEQARQYHHCSPVVTAALGRLLTGSAMMGSMCKNDSDVLTVQVRGDGPIGGMVVSADAKANVKGYAYNNQIELPIKEDGHLDVGGAVGHSGTLQVIKDLGLKEPYSGQTPLVSGEIAEDLTYYFASSEQIPTSVALGVLVDRDLSVRCAGGFIIQLMPFATEETISYLENRIGQFTSITEHLDHGETPEEIITNLFEGRDDIEFESSMPTQFHCGCSKERTAQALITVGKKELQSMIDDGEPIELTCNFCNSHYTFSVDELKELLEKSTAR